MPSDPAVSLSDLLRLKSVSDPWDELARDAREGLTKSPKGLPPKYFYDAKGSELFDQITRLDVYYPTRAESSLLQAHAPAIAAAARAEEFVEIGSGYSPKTAILLKAMREHGLVRYLPIDSSEDALVEAIGRLAAEEPWLTAHGIVADFGQPLTEVPRRGRRLVAFLGSTIGNLSGEERIAMLGRVHDMLAPEDCFLLGIDLVKERAVLERAYDDPEGITARFNLNLLEVLNRELDGNLPLDAFQHHALFDAELSRIEMRLRATRSVQARLNKIDLDVSFDAGEEMLTEISCKFTREEIDGNLATAGLRTAAWYQNSEHAFALLLARPV